MALKPRHGTWAYGPDAHTPADAARVLAWGRPENPGDWQPVTRAFRDGHTEAWWAADATLGWWGPDGTTRLVVATADPGTLPDKATWYLATNLPRPRRPARGRQPAPGGRPGGDRADLRHPALDRDRPPLAPVKLWCFLTALLLCRQVRVQGGAQRARA